MRPNEVAKFAETRRGELVKTFDEHLNAVQKLADTTSFNLDVASDILPSILDGELQAGREALHFWESLYAGFETNPQFVVFTRFTTYAKSGASLTSVYIRIFEGLTSKQVQFFKGDTAEQSKVIIKAPSTAITLQGLGIDIGPHILFEHNKAPLASSEVGRLSEPRLKATITYGDESAVSEALDTVLLHDDGSTRRTLFAQLNGWERTRQKVNNDNLEMLF